jgi:hypothetical protein
MQPQSMDGAGPNHMLIQIMDGPNPMRDSGLATETILHEYTHAMIHRLIGMGSGLTGIEALVMDEGLADFFSLSALSGVNNNSDVSGNYPGGPFIVWHWKGVTGTADLTENYYYGVNLFPYSVNHSKNPVTFKDLDANKMIAHTGIPRSPAWYPFGGGLDQYAHGVSLAGNLLWELRANLVQKRGFPSGNDYAMELMIEAMKTMPSTVGFIEARDLILAVDQTFPSPPGNNPQEIWAAFYKRGVGGGAVNLETNPQQYPVVLESFNREDLNLDGSPDIVFRTDADSMKSWLMDEENQIGQATLPSSGSTWTVRATADVNRDGKVDLILQNTNSFLKRWIMNGNTLVNEAPLDPPSPGGDPGWKVVGAGQFNDDTVADLVWEHDNGMLAVWYMGGLDAQGNVNESKLLAGSLLNPSATDPKWRIVGTGDFNQDGKTDLVFQFNNPGSYSDGDLAVWLMDGVNLVQASLLNPSNPGDPHWMIVATADSTRVFNPQTGGAAPDGYTDLIFQIQNPGQPNDGYLGIWFMSGLNLATASYLEPSHPGTGWKVVGPK